MSRVMDGWDSWKWSGEDKMLFVEMEISVTLRKRLSVRTWK
jgi:hypothetical protein